MLVVSLAVVALIAGEVHVGLHFADVVVFVDSNGPFISIVVEETAVVLAVVVDDNNGIVVVASSVWFSPK